MSRAVFSVAPVSRVAGPVAVRCYAAGSGLSKEDVEGRITSLLAGFDKVRFLCVVTCWALARGYERKVDVASPRLVAMGWKAGLLWLRLCCCPLGRVGGACCPGRGPDCVLLVAAFWDLS